MADTTVPKWIVTEVRYWIDLFNLEGWDIDVGLERVINNNADCMGWCERHASYNRATLHFRDDIEDTEKWRKVILHESLHIVMARVDAYVQDGMIPETVQPLHDFAGVVYTQLTESFVQSLTNAYWRFYREQMQRDRKKK